MLAFIKFFKEKTYSVHRNNFSNKINNMIASVQYNDLQGTAAADVSDEYMTLQRYLEKKFNKYNGKRYSCQGCTMWFGNERIKKTIRMRFLCLDTESKKFVGFYPERDFTFDEVYDMFKRFEIVIGRDVNNIEIDEDEMITL